MLAVWKYKAFSDDEFGIQMPKCARILCFMSQLDEPMIWALVNTKNDLEMRTFVIKGTGHPIDKKLNLKYIGSTMMMGDSLVWHLFEKVKEKL